MALGEYLFLRIAQANPKLKSIFGIAGDFNVLLLEHLYKESVSSKMEFVGICNELNAAYAADGYAKAIDGMSVLVTTFGVGELSAINGIAGAFAEYAPVLHIVGTTSLQEQRQAATATSDDLVNIHHLVQNKNSLEPPLHNVYKKTAEPFCVALESLDLDVASNLDKIDRVMVKINQENRPGYLYVPLDIANMQVPVDRLMQPIVNSELTNGSVLKCVSERILDLLYKAKMPSILGDIMMKRFHAQEAFDRFTKSLPSNYVKLFNSIEGRLVDESLPNFMGNYGGKFSCGDNTRQRVEQETDCLIVLGFSESEVNSGRGTRNLGGIANVILVHPDYIKFNKEYLLLKDTETGLRPFSIGDLMAQILQDYNPAKFEHDTSSDNIGAKAQKVPLASFDEQETALYVITQNRLLDFFGEYLRSNDIFVVETTSFLFGVPDIKFPSGVQFYSQHFYGSIGYALPATLGICRAERDLGSNRRIILVQGDGSAQMTVQELSSYLRHDIKAPEVFLLNNNGYTVERYIKGPTRSYNDIQGTWDWGKLLEVFGDKDSEKHERMHVDVMDDLSRVSQLKPTEKIRFMDLKLGEMDGNRRLKQMMPQN